MKKKVEKKPVRVAEVTRTPVFDNSDVMPYKDMEWSIRKKRWIFPDRRTPAEKARDRIRKRQENVLKRKWLFVSSRIPKGWYQGVSCGLGWLPMIKQLVEDIDAVWMQLGGMRQPNWVPVQVKEKFGGLRFYVRPALELSKRATKDFRLIHNRCWRITEALISTAESRSYSICERCTSPASRNTIEGCVQTICKSCHEKEMARRKKGGPRGK
jgi:hypothetical protein